MASKLIPSDPEKVMVIRRLTPDIITLSTPFLRFGRIKIGGRGTVVRLQTGALAVFSPVALTDSVKAEMQSLSPSSQVKYIAALDQEHHIFLESWHKAYPQARVIAPDTLPGLRDKQNYFKIPESNWHLFNAGDAGKGWSVDEEFDREFDIEYVHAHANKEIVFNHKPSRTLIEADLIFNLPATEQMSRTQESATTGFLTKLFTYFQNTQGKALGQKRFLWYVASASDRPSFNQSVSKIAGWDFDKIVPCHGDVIEKDGKGIFQKIMQWHLEGKNKSS
ncbi:hypothetical protein K431DRAFT_288572 [Polychaeton citri CBS 116435]|uniref:DUF4336 domain-containing protein n=1 Tax=Polychaeton citri CBS 116435 TaxID=1314669 RepID=A0A9P4Q2U9_9PEZI|nr:hypothetical protein K431DRAFT_288572 [Polychaeton citri CBS 116435]